MIAAQREADATRRLAGAIGVSAALHAGVVVALLVARGAAPPPAPPVYRVELVAAPKGTPAIGTVASEPPALGEPAPTPRAPTPEPAVAPTPPAPTPPPRAEAPTRATPAPAPTKTAPTPKPTPAAATPAPPAKATPPKPAPTAATTAPAKRGDATGTAGAKGPPGPRAGSAEGGRGADVANVKTPGLDFAHPGYLQNIVRQVRLRFNAPNRALALSADISFLIHRDGTVSDVRVVRSSRNYAFDLEARGAIEAAGTARAFGPLPTGFRDDVLPVTFSFDPTVLR